MTSQAQHRALQRKDRADIGAFAAIISASTSSKALHRDECGDWILEGKNGFVYALADHGRFYLYFCGTRIRWRHAKQGLAFCAVHQDGDDEGTLTLDRLPTAAEGVVIRKVLGIRKKRPPPAHPFQRKEAA